MIENKLINSRIFIVKKYIYLERNRESIREANSFGRLSKRKDEMKNNSN